MVKKLAILPGDGIGPEIMQVALRLLESVERKIDMHFECEWADIGGKAIDSVGTALPEATLRICEAADAILFGAVGGPKWESLPPEEQPERAALLPLRKHFEFFANLRPIAILPELRTLSPLLPERVDNVNIMFVRELTGDVYFAEPKGSDGIRAFDTMAYTKKEVDRIARFAFRLAAERRGKLCSIDKANVLSSMVLWRETVQSIAPSFPDVKLQHMYVDNAAMQLVLNPAQFDVILAPNMFGDILSDEGAAIAGSLGMIPSASMNTQGFGLYEPAGGSAPDIAGKNAANPIAMILSLSLLLHHSFRAYKEARNIISAVTKVIQEGYRTRDIAYPGEPVVGTREMGELINTAYLDM
jgi:3-isopropylmalate dehydrogenase